MTDVLSFPNRQWILSSRPEGLLSKNNLQLIMDDQQSRPLRSGEVRIKNLLFQCAPTMRNWMAEPRNSLHRTIELGTAVQSLSASRIVESRHPDYPVDTRIVASSSWSEWDILDLTASNPQIITEGISAVESMGTLGINTLTAYFGLTKIGKPIPGDTLVVSAAAGSVGSVVAQLGRINGCRVIGIAGSDEKCAWLKRECKIDETINYKDDDIQESLNSLCPEGVDIFFDNVGGKTLQSVIENMNKYGRIILCGQIGSYNDPNGNIAPLNMMRLIYGSITMQGFLYSDFADEIPSASNHLIELIRSGELIVRNDVRKGFENLPEVFNLLFNGSNKGTLLCEIHEDAHALS